MVAECMALCWWLIQAGTLFVSTEGAAKAEYSVPVIGEMELRSATKSETPSKVVGRVSLGKEGGGHSVELIHPPRSEWSLESVAAEGRRSVLKTLPSEQSLVLMPLTFIAQFPIRDQARLNTVLWEYAVNEGGMRFDYNRTYLVICVLEQGVPVGECRTVQVAHADVALYRREKPEDVWLYWALDSTEKATKSDVRLLVRDHDHDGYRDLVIWRRQCRSISLAEVAARERDPKTFENKVECDLDFVFEDEELLWMRFDPRLRAFGDSVKDEKLPAPPKAEWRHLPNLGLLLIR